MPESVIDADAHPVSSLDPYSVDFLSDPHGFQAELRDAGPVVWLERYGVWAMARHKEVHAALGDWQTFCSSAGVGLSDYRREKPWHVPSIILEVDPPVHTRTRAILTNVLTRRALQSLRHRFDLEAQALVERLVVRGEFDGMKDLAEIYPLKVFGDAIGLPPDGRENLMLYGSLRFNAFGPRNQLFEEAMAGAQPVIEWVSALCNRSALAPDGLGAQIFAAADKGEITQEEAKLLFRAFLSAGGDTTVAGIGAALYHCARNPDQWEALTADLSLVGGTFQEAIRIEPPIQAFFRATTRDVRVGGVLVPEGAKVMLFLASANRDPRRWENPDSFDIHRNTTGHVGFGAGIHSCLGQMIARMEGESLLTALARNVKSIRLLGEPKRRLNNTLHAWSSMPLAVQSVKKSAIA